MTFPTLASVVKYPKSSIEGNKGTTTDIAEKKFGYFSSEASDYQVISDHLGLQNKRHPISYLLEAADDIAYSAADIEDGVKLGQLNFDLIKQVFEEKLNKFDKDEGNLLTQLDFFYNEYKDMPSDRLNLTVQRFRIAAQAFMISSVYNEFVSNYDQILNGDYKYELLNKSKASNVRKAFKDLSIYVFNSRSIVETEIAGWEIIDGLLTAFIAAAKTDKFNSKGNSKEARLYNLISSSYRHIFENFNTYTTNAEYSKFQLVVDFVSGMTDTYALNLYQKLKGIKI